MQSIQIRTATVADVQTIRNIAMAAWPVTYSSILSVAQVEYMLGKIYHPMAITQQIRNKEQVYLLAYLNEQPLGFAAYSTQEEADIFKLQKLYIDPVVQKSGAGKALLTAVEKQCKHAGATKLILNVHRSNPARYYYEKNGFHIYKTIDIPFGAGFILNDYLMEKELK